MYQKNRKKITLGGFMNNGIKHQVLCLLLVIVVVFAMASGVNAFKQKAEKSGIEKAEFLAEELYVSQTTAPLADVFNQLPNKVLWQQFLEKNKDSSIYIDPRSGRPASLMTAIPIIPGTGDSNKISLKDISMKLGYEVKAIGDKEVKHLILAFANDHAALLGIQMNEIGEIRVGNPIDYLWGITIGRAIQGIPVRDAYLSFTINHGNVILWGLEKWGTIDVSLIPAVSKDESIRNGFALIGGRIPQDTITKEAQLELVPITPSSYTGVVGTGYNYRLVWTFVFQREGYNNTWEMQVDAHSGKVLAFHDLNQYALKKIVGSIYPVSNDGCCPDGCAYKAGMPYMNTGLVAPNNYTTFNGLFDWTTGTVTTTLDSRYITLGTDNCGAVSESSTIGDLDLGGSNGEHDCTRPTGHSAGDTFSSRSAAAELTNINREARSWVNYTWLDCSGTACITANVNSTAGTCNAYYTANSINFYRSGGGCRNTGEIAAVFDHEWGHGLDDYDTNGNLSSPGEVTADIVATIRTHQSCAGRGFWETTNQGCGQWTSCPTSPGTSFGYNCVGYGNCCTSCTGIRESDYAKHASGIASTPANFICQRCAAGTQNGPCGRETHCENAPAAEAVWDLAARDLQASPFNLDRQTAFQVTERVMYVGSGSVANWYTCTCPSTSGGCTATNGYLQFLAADDDNGNTGNGTPHMTAIYAAFNRHAIACAAPTPTNSGCATGPSAAPTLTVTPSSNGAALSWTAVTGATNYYIFKSISALGCDFGKALIATVPSTQTTYTDQALDCNQNNYMVQAVGTTAACLGRASNCVAVVPPYANPTNVTATASAANQVTVSWTAVTGATGYNVFRKYTVCGNPIEEKIASGVTTTSYVDTTVSGTIAYQYSVAATSATCGEHSRSDWVPVTATGTCAITPCFNGAVSVVNNKLATCTMTINWGTGTTSCSAYPTIKYNLYRSTDPVFVPSSANMIASCLTTTTYTDASAGLTSGTKYYYVLRAEDSRTGGSGPCNGGNADANLVRKNDTVAGPETILNQDTFEATTQWAHDATNSTCTTGNWIVDDPIATPFQPEYDTTAAPGIRCFFTAQNAGGQIGTDDVDGGVCTGRSGNVDMSGQTGVTLSYNYFFGTRDPGDDPTGDWFRIDLSNNGGTTWAVNLVLLGDISNEPLWTPMSHYLDSMITLTSQMRIRIQAQDGPPVGPDTGDIIEGGIDDVTYKKVTACTSGGGALPGNVLNVLTVAKSGTDLNLTWTAPPAPCNPSGYGLYRGALPWTAYNHASVNCGITGTTTSTLQDTGSYYYLIVPLTSSAEGSYGTSSSGTQRPQGTSPCRATQDTNPC